MIRQELEQLKKLIWQKRRSGATGEIDEMIKPLHEKMISSSAAIDDPTLKKIFILHCSGISPREMTGMINYSRGHISELIRKAERIVTGE